MGVEKKQSIILFDGVCNLCNSSINFVIKRDKKDEFRFTALQEEPGISLLKHHHIDTKDLLPLYACHENFLEPGL
jgi:predicted DCC family thiol-disulfide oxidoreductase YuxK